MLYFIFPLFCSAVYLEFLEHSSTAHSFCRQLQKKLLIYVTFENRLACNIRLIKELV